LAARGRGICQYADALTHVGTKFDRGRHAPSGLDTQPVNDLKRQFADADILAIERPDKALWTYYLLRLLVIPPLFPILILPSYFRYHTMRYRFTAEGISMKWGILFRREIILNYARIQDIHLQSNLIERWLGLARALVQTASGNAAAEMTIEGLKQFEAVRDFLYSKMRGLKESHAPRGAAGGAGPAAATVAAALSPETLGELTAALRETASEMRRIRELLAGPGKDSPPPP
jgi:membrane protein YdbS with pleckstrin-like domain